MKPSRLRKNIIDGLTLLLMVAFSLWLTRPWILHPLTRSIGVNGPMGVNSQEFPIGNPDIIMNLTFAGWLRFAITELHQWPLARTDYLMFPVGAAHGASFDGLLLAGVAALLSGLMPLTLAYNIAMLLGPVLCGFVFYRLSRRLWGRGVVAVAFGVNAACLPFLIQRLGTHPNLLYIWTIPVAVHLYLNFDRKPTLKRAAAWGLSFPLLALGSWHCLLIGLVFQCSAALVTAARSLRLCDWRRLAGLALAWALGCALVAVVGWPMLAHAGQRVQRSIGTLAGFSTPLVEQFLPYRYSFAGRIGRIDALLQRIGTSWEAWSGGPVASVVLLVLYLRWVQPRGPRPLIALAALLALAVTLGPFFKLTRVLPAEQGLKLPLYYLLREFPSLSMIHVPGRFAVLLHVMALLASGYMLQTLRERTALPPRVGRVAWPLAALALVGINLACTLNPSPVPTASNVRVPAFFEMLGRQPGRGAVLDLPISQYWFPQYNLYQFSHKRPAVSSVLFHDAVPERDADFIYNDAALRFFSDKNKRFFNESVVDEILAPAFLPRLAAMGIEFVMVHPAFLKYLLASGQADPRTAPCYARIEQAWRERLIYEDPQIRVYRTN